MKVKIDLMEGLLPLLLSLLQSVGEDLRSLHSQLDKCKITGQVEHIFAIGLKTKQGTHTRMLMEAVDYQR